MNLEKFTLKARDAIQTAYEMAKEYGHQEVEPEHLLLALCSLKDCLVPPLLKQIGVDLQVLSNNLEKELNHRPKVEGDNLSIYLSTSLSRALKTAEATASQLKDEYVWTPFSSSWRRRRCRPRVSRVLTLPSLMPSAPAICRVDSNR